MTDKRARLGEAIAELVSDGDVLALEGFTHLIPFAAAHEIIRQGRRDLTLVRMTSDIVADQLIAAGAVSKLLFAFAGNSSVGSLFALRRAIEASPPALAIEEYSHYGLLARYLAGASGLPFMPLRSYAGSDLVGLNPTLRMIESPYESGDQIAVVPPLTPDVSIIHAQRADRRGNVQAWGILGPMKEVAFAATHTIAVVEEVVDESVIRSDPNRTVVPGFVVDAVVEVPFGAHPSYAQGHYDRDNVFYREWSAISKDPARLEAWLAEWVLGVTDHADYLAKVGEERLRSLRPRPRLSSPVDYGSVR